MFNWQQAFDEHRVHYVTEGKNVGQGEINVNCPFCAREGTPDPSEHMGIHLSTGHWSCWRNSEHRGKRPVRLLAALLRLPPAHIAQILESGATGLTRFQEMGSNPWGVKTQAAPKKRIELLPSFKPINGSSSINQRFITYLRDVRGFTVNVEKMIEKYDLRRCMSGAWKQRIIFPIYSNGELAAWTSRSIINAEPKYKTLSPTPKYEDDDHPPAPYNIKETLYLEDLLFDDDGEVLIVTEGPLDALKIDFYSPPGVRATCLYGLQALEPQIHLLLALKKSYRKIVVVLDKPELSWKIAVTLGAKVASPDPYGDPGDFTPKFVKIFCHRLMVI